jgi:hypothetical protein
MPNGAWAGSRSSHLLLCTSDKAWKIQGIGQQYDPLRSCQQAFKSAGAPGIHYPPSSSLQGLVNSAPQKTGQKQQQVLVLEFPQSTQLSSNPIIINFVLTERRLGILFLNYINVKYIVIFRHEKYSIFIPKLFII